MLELIKNRHEYKKPAAALIVFFTIYMACFTMLENNVVGAHIVTNRLDQYIPFFKPAVIPYCFWFIWVPLVVLMLLIRDRKAFWRVYWGMALGCGTALLCYAIYPTGLQLRQTVVGTDILSEIIRLIYRTDTPTNVCPSLHVYQSLCVLHGIFFSDTMKRWRVPGAVITALICCSTVLMKQHSVTDVFCACLLDLAVCTVLDLSSRRKKRMPLAAHA